MDTIDWIHIIDEMGTPIVIFENHRQGKSAINDALLSNLLEGLKVISVGLNYDEIKPIKMGNKQFYLTKENHTNYTFIFKVESEKNSIDISFLINKILNLYLHKYLKLIEEKPREKEKFFEAMKEEIKDILNLKKPDIKDLII